MKNIDIKSLIIGFLSAIVIACGVAATGVNDKWDDKQEWLYAHDNELNKLGLLTEVQLPRPDGTKEDVTKVTGGWEPYSTQTNNKYFRKRIK